MPPDQDASFFNAAPDLKSRAGALGKALVYLLVAFISAVAVSALLKAATGQNLRALLQAGLSGALIAHAALFTALAVVPTLLCLGLWKEPFSVSGWSPRRAPVLAAAGVAAGAGLMGLIVLVLWVLHAWSGALAVSPARIGELLLLSALLWTLQAAHEEALHRGYAFARLSRAVSFWPAAALLSLWFAAGHLGQPGATPLSLAMAGVLALILAWSFLRTGSLWFALGFHASWNFAQSTVFGLANSGGESKLSVFRSTLAGPELLTGGSAGPEGSLLSLAAAVLLILTIRFVLPRLAPA
ncbi:CPBP family intramembrane glutamic endopeptidase [uncultured Caulobacter sp.]|uniref:CPBP family intramembrane glutamic endopeptidase n=1 Tax=uncultured Caulobacter sp. TaxID=158749 RepID=UPI0026321D1A|nr:type II CAAX endopeptidase family protein [uncultured Caulobacter sp.]